ncbi:hypothetical protein [Corynebacterium kroppenstedtii]|uniref:hypothetical protein n=1 Tax=Corynebacterium kroppenstedtii TaxID=161879 RepID=UPI0026EF449C|nr:hypothetical protein [Corynebacterium kroppenstedtii]
MSRVQSFVQACHSGADNSAAHTDDVLAHAGASAKTGLSAQVGPASDRIRMRLAQGNGDTSTRQLPRRYGRNIRASGCRASCRRFVGFVGRFTVPGRWSRCWTFRM